MDLQTTFQRISGAKSSHKPLSHNISMLVGMLVVLAIIAVCNSLYLYTNKGFSNANQVISFQIIIMALLVWVSITVAITLIIRVQKPISQLQKLALATIKNQKNDHFTFQYQDEFSQIASAFKHKQAQQSFDSNQKSQLANNNEEQIQSLVRQLRLAELTNICAELMFAQDSINTKLTTITEQLAELLTIEDIDLCLMHAKGQVPYLHISSMANKPLSTDCINNNCSKCITDKPFCARLPGKNQHKIPLIYDNKINNEKVQIGVIVVNLPLQSTKMLPWQEHCTNTIANQLAKVLSLR